MENIDFKALIAPVGITALIGIALGAFVVKPLIDKAKKDKPSKDEKDKA